MQIKLSPSSFCRRENNKVFNEVNNKRRLKIMMFAFIAILFLVIIGFCLIVQHYEEELNKRDEEIDEIMNGMRQMDRQNRFLKNEIEKAKSA